MTRVIILHSPNWSIRVCHVTIFQNKSLTLIFSYPSITMAVAAAATARATAPATSTITAAPTTVTSPPRLRRRNHQRKSAFITHQICATTFMLQLRPPLSSCHHKTTAEQQQNAIQIHHHSQVVGFSQHIAQRKPRSSQRTRFILHQPPRLSIFHHHLHSNLFT